MKIDLSKYPDRKFIKRINNPKYAGWQFSFERKILKESKFFNDRKIGSIDGAYEAAVKYRNEFLEAAGELGVLNEASHPRKSIPLVLKISPRNTSGIVGVGRTSRERREGRKREETWQANYQDEKGKNKQEQFSISHYGEKMALFKAVEFRRDFVRNVFETLIEENDKAYVKPHIEELSDILGYLSELEDDSDVFFLLSTINNPLIKNTQKQDILNIRIGQRRFRRLVLDYWGHKCVITKSKYFLTAGHIKPWKDANNTERLDVFNGLVLSPVFDKAFDNGFITFDKLGKVIVSKELKEEAQLLGINGEEIISGLNFQHQKYLEYHRVNIFKG
ncbi:MAG: hypothetical protein C0617_13550 [Desulfuromonas sp.]|uniref:HNH endonuclease n=1 Tax=Desulfuromonas sp. TaxID=892 RepID=UPI000CB86FC7|nr:HNH endonuclease [Desulfuromonas sp.]PLX82667.1 MAG: hypothetical protein C0617_13550 [Desulfuromonas sp.]